MTAIEEYFPLNLENLSVEEIKRILLNPQSTDDFIEEMPAICSLNDRLDTLIEEVENVSS